MDKVAERANVALLVIVAALALGGASEARGQELSLGSEPDRTLEAHGIFFLAGLKSRAHFGFGSDGFRKGEPAFVKDLGSPDYLPALGVDAAVNLGPFGWLGGEVVGFEERGDVNRLERLRRTSGVRLEEGDIVKSGETLVFGALEYGYEVRVRFLDALDLALSPTLGMGFVDLDVRLKRLLPEATNDLGGHLGALVVAPGVRLRAEAFGVVRLALEGQFGLTGEQLGATRHYATLWEHWRASVGVTMFGVDAVLGWRLDAMHLKGGGDFVDLRIDGPFFELGARF